MNGKICRGCGREFAAGEQFCPGDGSRLSSPSQVGNSHQVDPLIGMTLDARYRILRVIGEGGMGVVYEAEHVLIEKHVAIKVLRDTFTSRPDVVERFRQEAKSASKIGHPNIVDVSDFGETPSGQSYIVMEMLTGEDLADVLSRERLLSPARAARLVFQVARALHATHKKNIVHRDLKPENIYLIERDGAVDIVKVVDFGVAKMNDVETPVGRRLTRTGMIFGTPEYMSPEQSLGKPFDHRVDIYALGAIFFELLTGRVPFEGQNFMEILAKHGHAPVPSLRDANPSTEASAQLERIVMRALCKDPAQRYQTMGELANDLRTAPEMPSLEPGDALETPAWSLTTPPEMLRPPALSEHVLEAALTASRVRVRVTGATEPAPARSDTKDGTDGKDGKDASRRGRGGRRAELPVAQTGVPRSVQRWLWIAAAASAVVLGTAFGLRRAHEPRVTAAPLAPLATLETTTNAAVAVATKPAVSSIQPSGLVEVQVHTQPAGASVQAVGIGAHCQAAPCALSLPRGRPVTLRAQSSAGSVERTLTFDDEADIELRVIPTARAKSSPKALIANRASRANSDLKVPAIFREH